MARVTKIEPLIPERPVLKRVAAYARVSIDTEELHHSFSAQVSYYSNLIQKTPEWGYVGVYADEGISGTSMNRPQFQRMLKDCEAGMIDIILTKSISRFARNTVDLLRTVRRLKELGIEVRFEKEHINSLSEDGELMLSLLASFAQEESRSISQNIKWAIRKNFEQGIPNNRSPIYGYDWKGASLVINHVEAPVVKKIFYDFINGKSRLETARELNASGIKTKRGFEWKDSNVRSILTNITYTGNLLLQKSYMLDSFPKKKKENHGELSQYYVENTHEALIDMKTYQYVQNEIARRKALGVKANKSLSLCCFSGKIKCEECGKSYIKFSRKTRQGAEEHVVYWICDSVKKSRSLCSSGHYISDKVLKRECCKILELKEFSEDVFSELVEYISVPKKNVLIFHMKDGHAIEDHWESNAHKDCWTSELRKAVSTARRTRATRTIHGSGFTGFIKCAKCGMNYRHMSRKNKSIWYCSNRSSCHNSSIKDSVMRKLTAEILDIAEFDEKTMDDFLDQAVIDTDNIIFYFKDGHAVERSITKGEKECRTEK